MYAHMAGQPSRGYMLSKALQQSHINCTSVVMVGCVKDMATRTLSHLTIVIDLSMFAFFMHTKSARPARNSAVKMPAN